MPTTRYLSYHKRRRRRKNFLLIFLLILILAAAGVLTWLAFSELSEKQEPSSGSDESYTASVEGGESSSCFDESSEAALPAVPIVPEFSEPEEALESSSELPEISEPDVWTSYDLPLPAGEEVSEEYFNDAVFIGDSRTQGLILYTGLSGTTSYADKGLSVETVFTKNVILSGASKIPVMDALAQNETFRKVYLMFGVNELGWTNSEAFQERYRKVVQRIKEIKPDAIIYLQSVLPVSQAKSDGDNLYNNPKIQKYNQLIQEVAAEEEVYYLNVSEAVADETGALPAEATTDGVHLNKPYCLKWLAYLKNHTAEGIGTPVPAEQAPSIS